MRYDGIGMGGPGGAIAAIVIVVLVAFLVLSVFHKRFPRLVELGIEGVISLMIRSFWLIVTGLVIIAISIPVTRALELDRAGQLATWGLMAAALYLASRRLK